MGETRVQNLVARRGDRIVLEVPTFAFPERGLVIVRGANGSGKSLFLDILAGLACLDRRVVTTGAVTVSGKDALAAEPGALASIAPLLPQRPEDALMALDVFGEAAWRLEHAGVPEARGAAAVKEALAAMCLPDPARRSTELSAGEARRSAFASILALARGHAELARVILLDEPLEGLDEASVARMTRAITDLAAERLVIVAEPADGPLRDGADAVLDVGAVTVRPPPLKRAARSRETPVLIDARVEVPGILRHTRLALGPGLHVVTGPNGAGKSTLLRALAGVHVDARGPVTLAGAPPRAAFPTLAAAALHGSEAWTFAETVAEEAGGADACAALGLAHAAARAPHALSGGESRRLAVARALATTARVLLLDEPTAHQDDVNAARIIDALVKRADAGACVLVATLDARLLAAASQRSTLTAGVLAPESEYAREREVVA